MGIPASLKDRLVLPVVASPMFIVSSPELVIAQCKAGIVGSFPALNARPAALLDEWIVRIKRELADYQAANPDKKVAPFAVNQICHATNDRLMTDTEVLVKHQVPVVITSLQNDKRVIDAVHSYGGIVLHDVTNIRHAKKAVENGVDGLILVCAGAGGHAGALNPLALVAEVRGFYDGTVLLSGAIASGASILAAQAMGADMAYMGTRFIATEEANSVPEYKQMLVDSTASDIVYSSLFSGVPANYLKGSIRRSGLDPDNLPQGEKTTMNFGGGEYSKAKAWRDIWGAGQGTGAITDIPSTAEVVARLQREYAEAKQALQAKEF